MTNLVETIARSLVDKPDEVVVTETSDKYGSVIRLSVASEDMGKVIGKQGRIAKAIRTVVKAKAVKENRNVTVEIAKEVTLAPEKKTTDALAEVTYTDDRVDVSSPKDHTVMQAVKAAGFRWTGSTWEMQITVTTGSAVDRAAEIANKLLAAGVQVRVPVEIQKVAVEGNYTPRCTRWVIRITNDAEHVYVLWGRNENWYEKVKCISGAKWMHDLHYMCIPTSSADEVEEFAKLNGFQISAGAKLLINNYREKVKIVIPATAPIEETQSEANGLKDILNSSRDVIEDLKDD